MAIGYKGLDGLSKTIIIATSQTICQIIKKYYQTRVWGIYSYAHIGDMGYRGYRGLSKYRRIPPIPHIKTLNVSHNKTAGMAGYIKRYQTFLLAYIRHMKDMRLYGLMV
jgi:hypothetical protein